MIEYKTIQETKEIKTPISTTCDTCDTCDICKTKYIYDDNTESIYEAQEFLHIRRYGGYGSVFGDGETVECDICQHCLLTMINNKFRYSDE